MWLRKRFIFLLTKFTSKKIARNFFPKNPIRDFLFSIISIFQHFSSHILFMFQNVSTEKPTKHFIHGLQSTRMSLLNLPLCSNFEAAQWEYVWKLWALDEEWKCVNVLTKKSTDELWFVLALWTENDVTAIDRSLKRTRSIPPSQRYKSDLSMKTD